MIVVNVTIASNQLDYRKRWMPLARHRTEWCELFRKFLLVNTAVITLEQVRKYRAEP